MAFRHLLFAFLVFIFCAGGPVRAEDGQNKKRRRTTVTVENDSSDDLSGGEDQNLEYRPRKGGGQRHHRLEGSLAITSQKFEGSSSESKNTNINLNYIYDLGYFGFGFAVLSASTSSGSDSSTESTGLGGILRLNFVENTIANDLVPHLLVMVGSSNYTIKTTSGTNSITAKSTMSTTTIGLGVDIHPFSKYVAICPSLASTQTKGENNYKATTSGLSIGLALSF